MEFSNLRPKDNNPNQNQMNRSLIFDDLFILSQLNHLLKESGEFALCRH